MTLPEELRALFRAGVEAPLPDERFNDLALRVFAYQFERNRPYRAYCEARGRTPDRVDHWQEIPALPTAAFKKLPLTTFPPEEAEAIFETSGTTAGGRSGRHYMRTTALYDAALLPPFDAHVLPDGARPRMLSLGPSPRHSPRSSLGHMLGRVMAAFGGPGSAELAGERGIDLDGLARALEAAVAAAQPVCLLGTAFAFVHALESLEPARFPLPPGSRLMDTGGYKGRSREVPREELLRQYERLFNIPATHVISEYGMTEMSSQFYAGALNRRPTTHDNEFRPTALYVGPPWVRTLVVDPESLEPLTAGETGLLRHYDLANLDSVMAIQTDDLGVAHRDGFELLGRAAGAEARGCSLAVEELLRQQGAARESDGDA
jgi:hypothetical protein